MIAPTHILPTGVSEALDARLRAEAASAAIEAHNTFRFVAASPVLYWDPPTWEDLQPAEREVRVLAQELLLRDLSRAASFDAGTRRLGDILGKPPTVTAPSFILWVWGWELSGRTANGETWSSGLNPYGPEEALHTTLGSVRYISNLLEPRNQRSPQIIRDPARALIVASIACSQ